MTVPPPFDPQYPAGPQPTPQYPPAPPYPYPPAPPAAKSKTRWLWIVGGVIIAVVVAVIVGLVALGLLINRSEQNQAKWFAPAVGTCMANKPTGVQEDDKQIDCAQPHQAEVAALITVPGDDFPGQDAIDQVSDQCPDLVYDYLSSENADLKTFMLTPSADTWGQGDRTVVCYAVSDDERTGSAKG